MADSGAMSAALDLGLLSDVASSRLDPSLIDPALLPVAQHDARAAPHDPTRHDISVLASHPSHGLDLDLIDPSLRNLSNDDLDLDLARLPIPPPAYHLPPTAPTAIRAEYGSEHDSDTEGEAEDDGSDYALEPVPDSPTQQVVQLRELDDDATKSLAANREYQDELKRLMQRFEAASKRTNELKAFVTRLSVELLAGQEMKIFAPRTVEPTLPWFKHYYGRDLPPNRDGIERDRYLETIRFWPWSASERTKLKEEVMAHNHRKIALEASESGEDLGDKLASIAPEYYVENTDGLDWDTISLVMKRRSALDCKLQWLQHDHPRLNFKKFSKDEMNRLVQLVEGGDGDGDDKVDDWEEVAKRLGNGRVGWDCLKQYRRRPGQRVDWTKEQDDKLRDAVKTYGENWQIVARLCGRDSNACINRWSKSLAPTITRGKWSQQEDDALRTAVALVGKNWKEVAPRVSGRTDAQCRERWTNVHDPSLSRKKPWTPEQDQELLAAKEAGRSWAEIARDTFGGSKTNNNVMRRWQDLQKKPKAKSKKGKKKRLPKDTDEEDNVRGAGHEPMDEDEGGTGSQAAGQDEEEAAEEEARPKKRPKRQIQQKNPEVGPLFAGAEDPGASTAANEEDVVGRDAEEAARSGRPVARPGHRALRAGGDIVVDLDVFASEQELRNDAGDNSGVVESGANGTDVAASRVAKGKGKAKAPVKRKTAAKKRGPE